MFLCKAWMWCNQWSTTGTSKQNHWLDRAWNPLALIPGHETILAVELGSIAQYSVWSYCSKNQMANVLWHCRCRPCVFVYCDPAGTKAASLLFSFITVWMAVPTQLFPRISLQLQFSDLPPLPRRPGQLLQAAFFWGRVFQSAYSTLRALLHLHTFH